jgi:hypothetical protein
MSFDLQQATIHVTDGVAYLWAVTGDPHPQRRYATKLAAEMAARRLFPDERPETRDARVMFRTFMEV